MTPASLAESASDLSREMLDSLPLIIFGEHGQVARELHQLAVRYQIPVQTYSRQVADFLHPESVLQVIEQAPAGSWVINAAAYTNVDQAEHDEEAARQVNAITPGLIARACAARKFPLLQISTDYVFPGTKSGPYTEGDLPSPLGVYGRTKLEGELLVQQELQQSVILRTSWVFSPHGKNFVKTMLRLSESRRELSVVADQTGGPTSAGSIARACLSIVKQLAWDHDGPLWGTYHFCGAPATTWHAFAVKIFQLAGRDMIINAIPADLYPTPARRPANSQLDCSRIAGAFGIAQPDWAADLGEVLKELQAFPD